MKNIVLSTLFSCLLFASFSQKWSSFGLNLSYQGNKLLNANLKEDELVSSNFGFNPAGGFNFGINMNEYVQVSLEVGYAKVKNSLLYLDTDTVFGFKGERQISLNTLNLGLVFKVFSQAGYYAEFGAKYNLVMSAVDIENNSLDRVDASDNISNYMSFVLGGGVLAYKKNRTNLLVGFRGEFGFSDIISDYGKEIYYPTYKNYNNNEIYRYISGMIVVTLSYDIGVLNGSRQTYRYSYF